MNPNPAEQEQIKAYLNAVGANLTGPDRTETLADLESHIYEAIAARAGAGESAGVVDAVLTELDPPESYADSAPTTKAGICGLAIFGATLLPFGLPVLWHVVRLTPAGDHWKDLEFFCSPLYYFLILPLGLIAMVISPILGAMSVKRIRQSKGTLIGRPLAVLDSVFYPILLVDLVVFIVLANIMDVQEMGVPSFLVVFVIILVAFANILTFRKVCRRI